MVNGTDIKRILALVSAFALHGVSIILYRRRNTAGSALQDLAKGKSDAVEEQRQGGRETEAGPGRGR
jgi:hypothetical protein